MTTNNDKVTMRYEGDKSQHDKLECVFTYRGKEYRMMYYYMSIFAELYNIPEAVREDILFWAKMLNDPD